MSFINELFKSFARTLGRILVYVAIAIILMFFFTSSSNASTWIEFRKEGDEFLCGTQKDFLSCPYDTNIIGYNLIIENIELKSNKTYELEIYWNLQTFITRGDVDGYINENNWETLTATIDGKLWGVNGPSLPTKNRTWQKINQYKIFGVGNHLDTAVYQYKYSNVFDISSTESYERLYFEVRKRQQWNSLGVPPLTIPLVDPYVILSEFTYTLSEISDNGVANIIASGNKNANDIMNNQNQNTDKVIGAIGDLNDAINSTEIPGVDNFNYTDPNAGIITSFLTMPLTLLRVMSNTNTCQAVNLGELYGHPLILECVHPEKFLGDTLWSTIDYFIVFVMIGNIAQLFIYIYEKIKNLDDFFGEFYTPKHTKEGYTPRHGG